MEWSSGLVIFMMLPAFNKQCNPVFEAVWRLVQHMTANKMVGRAP